MSQIWWKGGNLVLQGRKSIKYWVAKVAWLGSGQSIWFSLDLSMTVLCCNFFMCWEWHEKSEENQKLGSVDIMQWLWGALLMIWDQIEREYSHDSDDQLPMSCWGSQEQNLHLHRLRWPCDSVQLIQNRQQAPNSNQKTLSWPWHREV